MRLSLVFTALTIHLLACASAPAAPACEALFAPVTNASVARQLAELKLDIETAQASGNVSLAQTLYPIFKRTYADARTRGLDLSLVESILGELRGRHDEKLAAIETRNEMAAAGERRLAPWSLVSTLERGAYPSRDGGGHQFARFSPDATRVTVASTFENAAVFDVATGEKLFELEGSKDARAIAVSPDGAVIATGDREGSFALWRASDGKNLLRIAALGGNVNHVFFNPRGTLVAVGNRSNEIGLWSVAERRKIGVLKDQTGFISPLAFSHDGKNLVSTGASGAIVWDVDAMKPVFYLPHTTGVSTAQFTPDDAKILTTTGGAQFVHVWDAKNFRPDTWVNRWKKIAKTGFELAIFSEEHVGSIDMVVSPDGRYILTKPFFGPHLTIRDADGKILRKVDIEGIRDVAFSSSNTIALVTDGEAISIDLATGQKLAQAKLPKRPYNRPYVTFSADGSRMLVISGGDDTAILAHPDAPN